MADQITADERAAIAEYLDYATPDSIRRPPGSALDPDSPNYIPRRVRPVNAHQRAQHSKIRLAIRHGLMAGDTMAGIARGLGMTERDLRQKAGEIGFTTQGPKNLRRRSVDLDRKARQLRIIRETIDEGGTAADAANKLKISARWVLRLANEAGWVFLPKNRKNEHTIKRAKDLAAEGKKATEIARIMKVSRPTVSRWMKA